MLLFAVVLAWIGLSIPIALLVGVVIRRGQRPIPTRIVERPSE